MTERQSRPWAPHATFTTFDQLYAIKSTNLVFGLIHAFLVIIYPSLTVGVMAGNKKQVDFLRPPRLLRLRSSNWFIGTACFIIMFTDGVLYSVVSINKLSLSLIRWLTILRLSHYFPSLSLKDRKFLRTWCRDG